MKEITGVGASRGIASGPAHQFSAAEVKVERHQIEDAAAEWQRLQDALEMARGQLDGIYEKVKADSGEEYAQIFQAQAAMLDDPDLLDAVQQAIEEEKSNAEAALEDAVETYARRLEQVESERIRARAADLRDVKNRVLRILLGSEAAGTGAIQEPSIVLARDLTPSDTALMDKSLVRGFCTAEGTKTSHAAILARGLGIPAVVGAGSELLDVVDGVRLILDGLEGKLVVRPDEKTVDRYRKRKEATQKVLAEAREKAQEKAVTRDGRRVEVAANIGDVDEAEPAKQAGAEGVGLLRTEFLYLGRTELPDEEEQFQAYWAILETFEGDSVILRTLDVGGDKQLPYLELPQEMNPFLGLRAIRLSLRRPELFRPQLRAALRAGAGHRLKIMFPMVTALWEVEEARAVLEACREELRQEGHEVAEEPAVGIMIEVPSAALMADHLAHAVDFFSIGTNDLTQYVMAVDRTNADIASLASDLHPAVLRLVRQVIEDAHGQDTWVGMCGELAGNPLAIPILVGLGLDELSMAAPAIPVAKEIIRSLDSQEAADLSAEALEMQTAEEVEALVRNQVPAANV